MRFDRGDQLGGGVMGKMIDAQSIMVACAACYDDPKERSHALGPIFRTVFWHSIAEPD
jgi:lactate permease